MRIRTAQDVEKLDQRIKTELGIDVRKYRNEEVVENFIALLVFPEYVITWVIRPILFAILAFIGGYFLIDLVHIEYLLYTFLGFGLFLVTGVLLGLLFLTLRMKADMWGIIDYSLNIMKSAVSDLIKVNGQINPENRSNVLGLLFKGIIHIVTIPMLSAAISEKVPLVGGIINRFVKKVLTLVSDRVKFDEQYLKEELSKKEDESSAIQTYQKSISLASTGLRTIMNFTFGIAQLPIKLGFGIFCIILILFIYLIN